MTIRSTLAEREQQYQRACEELGSARRNLHYARSVADKRLIEMAEAWFAKIRRERQRRRRPLLLAPWRLARARINALFAGFEAS